MTLTRDKTPSLTTLMGLAHEWRFVARRPYFGVITVWEGDLSDPNVRRRFQQMVVNGSILCLTHRNDGGADTFAKIRADLIPRAAHAMSMKPIFEIPMHIGRLTPEQKREAQERLRGGESIRSIARDYKVSTDAIRKRLKA